MVENTCSSDLWLPDQVPHVFNLHLREILFTSLWHVRSTFVPIEFANTNRGKNVFERFNDLQKVYCIFHETDSTPLTTINDISSFSVVDFFLYCWSRSKFQYDDLFFLSPLTHGCIVFPNLIKNFEISKICKCPSHRSVFLQTANWLLQKYDKLLISLIARINALDIEKRFMNTKMKRRNRTIQLHNYSFLI